MKIIPNLKRNQLRQFRLFRLIPKLLLERIRLVDDDVDFMLMSSDGSNFLKSSRLVPLVYRRMRTFSFLPLSFSPSSSTSLFCQSKSTRSGDSMLRSSGSSSKISKKTGKAGKAGKAGKSTANRSRWFVLLSPEILDGLRFLSYFFGAFFSVLLWSNGWICLFSNRFLYMLEFPSSFPSPFFLFWFSLIRWSIIIPWLSFFFLIKSSLSVFTRLRFLLHKIVYINGSFLSPSSVISFFNLITSNFIGMQEDMDR